VAQAFAEKTTGEWVKRLTAADLLHARINSYGDWLADTHVNSVGAAAMLAQPEVGKIPTPHIPGQLKVEAGGTWYLAPAIGEHTREILSELGYANEEIEALNRNKIVRLQPKEERRGPNE
jgi:crotonobetainyl-CoA:carnitine CoA-transferase CaiB-like acyl-CoA transferase